MNDGGPAFPKPTSERHFPDGEVDINSYDFAERGMSLRDWFAGQALNGWLASFPPGNKVYTGDRDCGEAVAELAYYFADAMLTEREKEEK